MLLPHLLLPFAISPLSALASPVQIVEKNALVQQDPLTFLSPASPLLQRQLDWNRRADSGIPESGWAYNSSSCGGYNLTSVDSTASGLKAQLSLIGSPCYAFGIDYQNLVVEVEHQSKERLRVHIYDAEELEFKIPESVFPPPGVDEDFNSGTSDLVFNYDSSPFAFWITRSNSSSLAPIFDTRPASKTSVLDPIPSPGYGGVEKTNGSSSAVLNEEGGLVFEAGYLEISSSLPIGANIYGLSESVSKSGFRRDSSATVQALWARDAGNPEDQNEYGSHPTYLETRFEGNASNSHGVFLSTSQGADLVLRDGVVEYRVLGGSLDFYFVSGPTPVAVIEQFSHTFGQPALPPYWAFGFHLCRWGYDNVSQSREMVEAMRVADIPLETAWNDIDWMDTYRNFVSAPGRFDPDDYKEYIGWLHENHQHYVPILDGAIAVKNNNGSDVYDVYDSGSERGTFMRNPDGSEYWGQVWPGVTVFPDWFANATADWWVEAFMNMSKTVEFDGIWLDMNEPSSFCDGSCGTGRKDLENITTPFLLPGSPGNVVVVDGAWPEGYNASLWGSSGNITINGTLTFNSTPPTSESTVDRRHQLFRRVGQGVDVNEPAYQIHNALARLSSSTVSPNATHEGGIVDFDVHSSWGLQSEQATAKVWETYRPGVRPFIVARSTAPGSGRHAAHWLGDNYSTWKFMKYSIQGVLQFQIFGIPMVGADVCGFNQNTDEELCNRWMQLGAFTPFFRNHNTRTALSQEPYRWDSVAEASRKAISARYALLPFWYTLFWQSSISGTPPIRALFFDFDDASLLDNDSQFLIGSSLLVTPVLEPNVSSVVGALPGGEDVIWRDWWTHEVISANSSGFYEFSAPLSHIPVTLKSSSILLLHAEPSLTIYDTLQHPYSLLVSLAPNSTAEGLAFVDDGETFNSTQKIVHFGAETGKVFAWTEGDRTVDQNLEFITVLGVSSNPAQVTFNGAPVGNWTWDQALDKLVVNGLEGDLSSGWELNW